jgi:hypothetical protein
MTITINGTSGVTFPAGGVANPAGSYVGVSDTQTLTNKFVSFQVGSATVPIIQFAQNSNAVLTTPAKGAIEYDGEVLYYDPAASARGVIPNLLTFCLTANSTGAASASAQSLFGANNGSTLNIGLATTYMFKMNLVFTKSAGAAATSLSLGFAGTATVSNIFYRGNVYSANNATVTGYVASGAGQGVSTTTAATVVFAPITSASAQHQGNFYGVVTFSGTGTFIPQYTLSNSGGAVTLLAGSNITMWPIGDLGTPGTSVYVGNWT